MPKQLECKFRCQSSLRRAEESVGTQSYLVSMLATFGWLLCLNRLGNSNSLLPSIAVQCPLLLLLLLLYQELRTGCSTRWALPATMLGMLSLLGML